MFRLIVTSLLVAVFAYGCESSSPTAPSSTAGTALSSSVRVALEEAIADEYRAETIYQGVIADFGSVAPFVNILTAEQRHSSAIARLFVTRGLSVPANAWTVATVPHYPSLPAACAAGVITERENIAIYDRVMSLDLPVDVRAVFENNRAASLFNHLPAFERCAP